MAARLLLTILSHHFDNLVLHYVGLLYFKIWAKVSYLSAQPVGIVQYYFLDKFIFTLYSLAQMGQKLANLCWFNIVFKAYLEILWKRDLSNSQWVVRTWQGMMSIDKFLIALFFFFPSWQIDVRKLLHLLHIFVDDYFQSYRNTHKLLDMALISLINVKCRSMLI